MHIEIIKKCVTDVIVGVHTTYYTQTFGPALAVNMKTMQET